MSNKVYLDNWMSMDNGTVKLTYKDGGEVYVQKTDFDRAFSAIVSADKSAVIRDFAIKG